MITAQRHKSAAEWQNRTVNCGKLVKMSTFVPPKTTKCHIMYIPLHSCGKPLVPAYLQGVFNHLKANFHRSKVSPAAAADEPDVSVLTGFVAKWSPSGCTGRKEDLDGERRGILAPREAHFGTIWWRRESGLQRLQTAVHVLLSNKSCLVYEQILLVGTTGNQRSVNICCYLLITRRCRLMAVLKYPRRRRGAAWNGRPLPFVNALQIKKRETTKLKRQTTEARWSSI